MAGRVTTSRKEETAVVLEVTAGSSNMEATLGRTKASTLKTEEATRGRKEVKQPSAATT
jgi:hypothetical protein